MGNKVAAREAMEKAGLPLLPGARGVLQDGEEAEKIAEKIGFPVILKAAAGGGGRGMKIVREASAVRKAFETASTEALAAFGDGSMYLERYVEEPRHIELQIVADEHGNIIHLGERECSVQRRHQKMIEEAPSPAVSPELRREMGEVALKAMRGIGYNNVGTIEFLLDEKGRYYFMEMNTRIQVEHPVTEQVYGLDLVREQIRLADGEPLERTQESVVPAGPRHRVPGQRRGPGTFAPSPGTITGYHQPGGYGVRVDTMAYEDYKVQPYYDSLVAKLIVTGATRARSPCSRMRRALDEYVIEGIKTNIPFHRRVLEHPAFLAGRYDTRIVDQILSAGADAPRPPAVGRKINWDYAILDTWRPLTTLDPFATLAARSRPGAGATPMQGSGRLAPSANRSLRWRSTRTRSSPRRPGSSRRGSTTRPSRPTRRSSPRTRKEVRILLKVGEIHQKKGDDRRRGRRPSTRWPRSTASRASSSRRWRSTSRSPSSPPTTSG